MAGNAKDAKTKVDKPEQEGTGTPAKEEPETTQAAAEAKAEHAEKAEKAEGGTAPQPSPNRAKRPAGERVTVQARARYVRTSARKARLVSEHIKGKSVDDARAILAFHPRSVAEDWRKLLDSAVANAEHNHDLVGDDLRVLNATADEGPTLKRYRPRAHGRATRIRKRTSHLTITLTPKEN
jgi:ribosomal protein L22